MPARAQPDLSRMLASAPDLPLGAASSAATRQSARVSDEVTVRGRTNILMGVVVAIFLLILAAAPVGSDVVRSLWLVFWLGVIALAILRAARMGVTATAAWLTVRNFRTRLPDPVVRRGVDRRGAERQRHRRCYDSRRPTTRWLDGDRPRSVVVLERRRRTLARAARRCATDRPITTAGRYAVLGCPP
jgi:hypothetical protein